MDFDAYDSLEGRVLDKLAGRFTFGTEITDNLHDDELNSNVFHKLFIFGAESLLPVIKTCAQFFFYAPFILFYFNPSFFPCRWRVSRKFTTRNRARGLEICIIMEKPQQRNVVFTHLPDVYTRETAPKVIWKTNASLYARTSHQPRGDPASYSFYAVS